MCTKITFWIVFDMFDSRDYCFQLNDAYLDQNINRLSLSGVSCVVYYGRVQSQVMVVSTK